MRGCSVVGDCLCVRESFGWMMRRLPEELNGLFDESHRLEGEIRERLGAIGHGK